ncbi:hypothetical protein GGF32_009149 [Allomyces javanicus]|nr:hypothetical protein GGF32_009149 [Allomyces javanicus]
MPPVSKATNGSGASAAMNWHDKDEKSKKKGLHATVYLTNGDTYTGEWHNNLRHGRGVQVYKKRSQVYEGKWINDRRGGFGTLSVPAHSAESPIRADPEPGTARDALRTNHPKPHLQLNEAAGLHGPLVKIYAGDWQDDERHGVGTAYYPDGARYEGQWVGGMRCGWGTMHYADGARYDGEWRQDKRHGQGILLLANHDRFEGIFVNDMKEGPGKFFYKQRHQVYEGEWSADMPKCGTIRDIEPRGNAGRAAGPALSGNKCKLPALELADPDDVLATRRQEIMQERIERLLLAADQPAGGSGAALADEGDGYYRPGATH